MNILGSKKSSIGQSQEKKIQTEAQSEKEWKEQNRALEVWEPKQT